MDENLRFMYLGVEYQLDSCPRATPDGRFGVQATITRHGFKGHDRNFKYAVLEYFDNRQEASRFGMRWAIRRIRLGLE